MADVVTFECPVCKLSCRLSQRQRALQHQVPECVTFRKHKSDKTLQEFLMLAFKAAALPELSNAVIDVEWTPEEHAAERRLQRITDKEREDLIEQIAEGVKKL